MITGEIVKCSWFLVWSKSWFFFSLSVSFLSSFLPLPGCHCLVAALTSFGCHCLVATVWLLCGCRCHIFWLPLLGCCVVAALTSFGCHCLVAAVWLLCGCRCHIFWLSRSHLWVATNKCGEDLLPGPTWIKGDQLLLAFGFWKDDRI